MAFFNRHYHSMEVFASFDITSMSGEKIADGHKASFCLEDNKCANGIEPKYQCANYGKKIVRNNPMRLFTILIISGDQGISVNCTDVYKYNIDCQCNLSYNFNQSFKYF